MYIPIVPFVPHTTIINKTIVYSDTVLSLNAKGSNLEISSISDVSEYSLERCLKTILETNRDVIFNTIQYSQKDKKIYFYTDKPINTQAWDESKSITYEPVNAPGSLLREISCVLATEPPKDTDCISLFDVATLVKKMKQKYESIIDAYRNSFKNKLNHDFVAPCIIIYPFDYEKQQLEIGFKSSSYQLSYDNIVFTKRLDDLQIVKSDSLYDQKMLILARIGKELSELFDKLLELEDFKEQSSDGIKSVNANFLSSIDSYGVDLYIPSLSNAFDHTFSLFSSSSDNAYDYKCNSAEVLTKVFGQEDEIFKKVFVKIDDCPDWSKQELYRIRQEQLQEEWKKQNKLERRRKLFPWFYKH